MGGSGADSDDETDGLGWTSAAEAAAEIIAAGRSGDFDRWVNEVRVEEAVRRRSTERWLRQQAEEEARLVGVLLDLAERGSSVVLHTRAGRVHGGTITQVGADFVRMTVPSGGDTLISLHAVASLRTLPGEVPVTGDRSLGSRTTLVEQITELTADRERAVIVPLDGAEPVCGVVASVGRDVVVLHLEGDGPGRSGVAYVPLASIGEVVPGV